MSNIIFVIVAQAFIIEKANKCLDYTLTIFIIHVVIVCFYTGRFPFSLEWWLSNFAIILVTVVLAEFVLMRIEQQEIKLSFDSEGINKIVEQGKKVIVEVSSELSKKKPKRRNVAGGAISS